MKEKILNTLEFLKEKNIDYADIRTTKQVIEKISVENRNVNEIIDTTSYGVGIRVLKNGYIGFACTHDINDIKETALKAYNLAELSKVLYGNNIELDKGDTISDNYCTSILIDPFDIPKTNKIKFLINLENIMITSANINSTSSFMEFKKEEKIYANTEGSYINQTLYSSGIGINAIAMSDNDLQIRTYPNSSSGNYKAAGYEYILSLDMVHNAIKIAREAEFLINAEDCPSGYFDIILDGSQLAVQIHETIGHSVELDRILGWEKDYSGSSFLKINDLKNEFKYGSKYINISSDATIPYGLGTFKYDDEGIKAKKIIIVDKGILKNFLTSCDTAKKIGQSSNASSRAENWNHPPIIRMTNINLEPGNYTFNNLVKEINYGLYICCNKSWSVNDTRSNFQFTCQIAYEIKNGMFTGRIFKNPIISGETTCFWRSCDGICDKSYWDLYSITNCGKGNPMQNIHISHGSSPARFRHVKVGV